MAGNWKILFIWIVIAAAGLIYWASFKLPVVAAMEQGVITVSEQLPSLVNETVGTIMTGENRQEGALDGDDKPITAEGEPNTEPPSSQDSSPLEEAASGQGPSNEASVPEPVITPPDAAEPTGDENYAVPAPAMPDAEDPSWEDQLAAFLSTRVGRLLSETNSFPAHNVDDTGEFVFESPSIYGSHFTAYKERETSNGPMARPIPTGFSAFTYYNNGSMDGFTLYKNMKHSPLYGDCYISMSASGWVSFEGLTMEVTELYAQSLIGVRIFPIINLWTTNPGQDLPLGAGEIAPDDDAPFYGTDFKTTVIKMTASSMHINNFSLSVREGRI